ncbi:MAG: sugar phosphate nucleotidyltransferase [Tissierellia bacterium]|nr:sugar phosphate nucleotidyltransferase [Tissierellia bacterium]
MEKPVLVIMAAGMGSRYGGLKQIDPVDKEGNIIMDYSIYDAVRAGFEKVIFIIKKENEKDFRQAIGDRISEKIEVAYVFQDLRDIPQGLDLPQERIKPLGTAHAIYSAREQIKGPFAVINADDYYGRDAFNKIYNFLSTSQDDDKYRYTMVAYRLANTVTDNGYVSRGVCQVDGDDQLVDIVERTMIEKHDQKIEYSPDEGKSWLGLDEGSLVSMNMWGFSRSILDEIEKGFKDFFYNEIKENPLKAEYFLPKVVSDLLSQDLATVKVLNSEDKWYGITYKEDKQAVVKAVQDMKDRGLYPQGLWK